MAFIDELLRRSGQFTGQLAQQGGNIPMALTNAAVQGGFGLGQPIGQSIMGNLPPVAIEEGKKVLKKFYQGMAQETVQQPNGAQILAVAIGEMPSPQPNQPIQKQPESNQAMRSTAIKEEPISQTSTPSENVSQNQQIPQQPQGNLSSAIGQLLMGMSEGARGLQPGAIQREQLENQRLLQELLGQKPLQPKDIMEMGKEGTLKPNELFTKYEQAVQPFIISRDAHARVEEAAKDPSAAGDLALIFNYMKVLDPGSTVREGEFASAQNSAGIPERIRNIYNRVISGKRLGTAQRADFLDRSRRLFKGTETQTEKTVSEFRKLAVKNRLDPDILFRDVGFAGGKISKYQEGQTAINPKTGQRLTFKGGKWQ